MNYGYAGTKELNEALVSRFLVIDMQRRQKKPWDLFPQNVPGGKGKGSGTVYRCIYGSSEEIRKQ